MNRNDQNVMLRANRKIRRSMKPSYLRNGNLDADVDVDKGLTKVTTSISSVELSLIKLRNSRAHHQKCARLAWPSGPSPGRGACHVPSPPRAICCLPSSGQARPTQLSSDHPRSIHTCCVSCRRLVRCCKP